MTRSAFNHRSCFSLKKKKKFRVFQCLVFLFVFSGDWDLFDRLACLHASVQKDVCMQMLCVFASPVGEFAIPVSPAWWTGLGGEGRGTSASSPGDCYLVSSTWGSPSAPWAYRPSQFEMFNSHLPPSHPPTPPPPRSGSARANPHLVVGKEDVTWLGPVLGCFEWPLDLPRTLKGYQPL